MGHIKNDTNVTGLRVTSNRRHIKKDFKVRHYYFYLAALSIHTFAVRVENATAISVTSTRFAVLATGIASTTKKKVESIQHHDDAFDICLCVTVY
jgi:hypothetical protein